MRDKIKKDSIMIQFLGELERLESRLLSWGVVEASFAEDELLDKVSEYLDRTEAWGLFDDALDFINVMVDQGLLFQWDDTGEYRYRTRMAETVRLMSGLKQLFPKHLRGNDSWLSAASLVSDYRFICRPREYPIRDQNTENWIQSWSDEFPLLSALQIAVTRALLSDGGGELFTLAGFQTKATSRILTEIDGDGSSGTVVCAGTGSGKTLAFYLPALIHIAGSISRDSSSWVRALAIYPRNELLKDQASETLSQARKMRQSLIDSGGRGVRVGAYFGDAPDSADYDGVEKKWKSVVGGHICPFLVCPESGCAAPLIWKTEDQDRRIEQLCCAECHGIVSTDEVVLTRRSITNNPPDILFTTTEMMNQRMTDSRCGHIFGIGVPPEKKPTLLLLDEAHTYNGSHGAQVSYLLRRWRHRSKATPHIVGLSATLMEAASFFAQLTGLNGAAVQEVSPELKEITQSGMEYQLALRGDPVSGTSLLSTTIQAGMLLRRSLDARNGKNSRGAYGRKVFLFTDNLDVTNRMFHNLLDAEGQNSWGRPDPQRHPGGSLANLRSPSLQDEARRYSHAQSWRMPEELGHDLSSNAPMVIARVSSQDDGVNADADIIVATASLEVGFNDPNVGAVMQHKAPHDPASFLQRKGRAGRKQLMRPWTVVVLSDFGRDRLAYQGYDLLFDPELRARDLPLANRHILKIQSVYAFMDWLSFELPSDRIMHIWSDVASPACRETNRERKREKRERQRVISEKISEVLSFGDAYYRLSKWLESSLQISSEEVEFLFWDSPRALLTSVLPTLSRRLDSQWLRNGKEGGENHHYWKPLPEFIPASLFNGLSLPEVTVLTANNAAATDIGDHAMAVNSALREFAPGRISRRYGVNYGNSRHWIPLDPGGGPKQQVHVLDFCEQNELEEIGSFSYIGESHVKKSIRVLRPYVIKTKNDAHRSIKDSSSAFPIWHSQILCPHDADSGVFIALPRQSRWKEILHEIRFYMHRDYAPARIRRFTTGSNASLLLDGGESIEIESTFSLNDEELGGSESVALGFAFEADALRFLVTVPDHWQIENGDAGDKLPSLRSARFRDSIKCDARLDGLANVFQRGWIAEVVLSSVIATAVSKDTDIGSAWGMVKEGNDDITLLNALSDIFQTIDLGSDDHGGNSPSRLDEIRDILEDSTVMERIEAHVGILWQTNHDDWQDWLIERYLATLGASFREAIQQLCPDVDAESLLIDIDQGPRDGDTSDLDEGVKALWISEPDPGGGGVIEKLLPKMAEEPGRFLDLARCALAESDFELADKELTRFLDVVIDDPTGYPEVSTALANVRSTGTVQQFTEANKTLHEHLRSSGFQLSHVVLAALNSRVLRPGSNSGTDRWSRDIHSRWRVIEAGLGIEVDARSLAYAVSHKDEFDQALQQALHFTPGQNRQTWRFNAIYGMLWPRGAQARNSELSIRNAFSQMPEPERLLVLDILNDHENIIPITGEGWRSDFEGALIENGRVAVSARPTGLIEFKKELISLLMTPVDTGIMLVYPRIRGVRRSGVDWVVEMELVVTGEIDVPAEVDIATDRLIVKTAKGNRDEVRDLLESLFVAELMAPSPEFWLVSPWISDVAIIDNRAGGYVGLEPSWPKRKITLAEILACTLNRSPEMVLHVVTRPPEFASSRNFVSRLKTLIELDGNTANLHTDEDRETLHTKGLATPSFAWIGSMNFTNNGIEILDETVKIETDASTISQFLISMSDSYVNHQKAP